MKKIIGFVTLCAFLMQMSNALQLKQYLDFQNNEKTKEIFEKGFDSSTDLIRGLIMLRDGALKEHRNFGNAEFHFKNAEMCSRDDKSDDAMTQLLILTHPSTGGSGFNATGEGSISQIFSDSDDVLQIIAGMFKIANAVRNRDLSKPSGDIGCILKAVENKSDSKELRNAVLSCFSQDGEILNVTEQDLINILEDRRKKLQKEQSVMETIKDKAKTNGKVLEAVHEILGNELGLKKNKRSKENLIAKSKENLKKLENDNAFVHEVSNRVENSEEELEELIADSKKISEVYRDLKKNGSSTSLNNLKKQILSKLGENETKLQEKIKATEDDKLNELIRHSKAISDAEETLGANATKEDLKQTLINKVRNKILLFECVKQIASELSEDDLNCLVKNCSDAFEGVHSVDDLSQRLQDKTNALENIRNAIAEGSKAKLKDQVGENSQEIKKLKMEKWDKLVSLAKAVAGAVLLERLDEKTSPSDEEKWVNHPYYAGYANDIICAYACEVISGSTAQNDLKKLAENMKDDNRKYISGLSKIVAANSSIFPSFIPFDAGRTPITNSSGILSDFVPGGFPDCVETTLRQLFSLLFCSGNSELAIDRIPPNSNLMEFFKNRKIREAANDGSKTIRDAWAAICAGYVDRIRYSSPNGYEVSAGWINIIKLFCLLMNDYKCKENVAELISDINSRRREIKTSEDVIEVLNTLLEIRDDVKLKAIGNRLSNGSNEVFGHIEILPEVISFQINNALDFYASDRHACIGQIEETYPCRIKNIDQIDKLIKELFPKDKFRRLEFYKSYLDKEKSNEKTGWVGLISSLSNFEVEKAKAVLKEWSCKDVLDALKEILEIETKLEVTEHSLEKKNNEIFGTVKLKSSKTKEEIIISLNDDSVNFADSSGFRHIEDLYYNKGYAFIDENSTSVKESLYPVLAFYTQKNKKILPLNEVTEVLDSCVGKSFFSSVYRACHSSNFGCDMIILDKLESNFNNYMKLCIDNENDMSALGEIVSYLSRKNKLDVFKERIVGRIKVLMSGGKNFNFRCRDYSQLFSPLAFDESAMRPLATYAEYVYKNLEKNSLDKRDAITVIGWIINKTDLSNVSNTDESFQKIRKLVQEFMKEGTPRDFCLTDENLATSKKHLELLLPICSVKNPTIADKVINQLDDKIDESIIPVSWRISDEKLDEFLEQIKNDEFCKEKYRALLMACCSENEKRKKVLKLILDKVPNIADFLVDNFDYNFSSEDIEKILDSTQKHDGNVEKVCCWFFGGKYELTCDKSVGNWVEKNRPDLVGSILFKYPSFFSTNAIEQFLTKTQNNGGNIEDVCRNIMMNGEEENIKAVVRWAENNFEGFLNLVNVYNLRYFSVGAIEQFLIKIQEDTSLLKSACSNLIATCEALDMQKLREIGKWMGENHIIYPLATYILDYLSDKDIRTLLEKMPKETVTTEILERFIQHCIYMDLENGIPNRFEFVINWILDNHELLKELDPDPWIMLPSIIYKYASVDTIKKMVDNSMKYGVDCEFFCILVDLYERKSKDSDNMKKFNSLISYIFDNYPSVLYTELRNIPSEVLIDQLNRTKEQQIGNSEYYDDLLAGLLANFSQETRKKIVYWILNNRSVDTILNILRRCKGDLFFTVFSDFMCHSASLREPEKAGICDQLANRVLENFRSLSPHFAVRCYSLFCVSNFSEDLRSKFLEKINIDDFKDINNLNFVFSKIDIVTAAKNIREIFRQKSETIPDEVADCISYYESFVKGQIVSQ